MAWVEIPDSVLEPGKPIRSVDGIALRDNVKALAAGDNGAPRIQNPAYGQATIDASKLWDGPTQGAATRSNGYAFNLTFGEGSGTSFVELGIDTPAGKPIMIMARWDPTLTVATRWLRLFRNGQQLMQLDQKNDVSLYINDLSVSGAMIYRLEFQRPSGGVVTTSGVFTVICPVR